MKTEVDYKKLSDSELIKMSVGKGKSQWLERDSESGKLLNRDEVVRLNTEDQQVFGKYNEYDKGPKKQSKLLLWISMAVAAAIVWAITYHLFK